MKYLTTKQLATKISRNLRKQMTPAENVFWEKVRDKQFISYKFQRQYPIFFEYYGKERFFVADFYCHSMQLVVEIDGGIHEQQKDYDIHRSEILESQKNLKIIRFKNEEVLNNVNKVLIKLRQVAEPNPGPSLERKG